MKWNPPFYLFPLFLAPSFIINTLVSIKCGEMALR